MLVSLIGLFLSPLMSGYLLCSLLLSAAMTRFGFTAERALAGAITGYALRPRCVVDVDEKRDGVLCSRVVANLCQLMPVIFVNSIFCGSLYTPLDDWKIC